MKRKLSILGAGLITALFLFEFILRLSAIGSGTSGRDEQPVAPGDKKKERIILALGNSFTLGVGATRENSYPAQLERLLVKEYGEGSWRIINRGKGNINTYGERLRFRDEIEKYHPDLILFLGGQPNWWNNYGFESYLKGEESFSRKILENFKMYKLFEQWSAFHKKSSTLCHLSEETQVQEEVWGMEYFNQLAKNKKLLPELTDKWIPHWEKGLLNSRLPDNKDVFYALLGEAYFFHLGDQKKGLDYWMKGIDNDRCGSPLTWANSYVLMRSIEKTLTPELQKVVDEFKAKLNDHKKMALEYDSNLVSRWVLHDLNLLYQEAKNKKVPIVFINYPPLKKQYYGQEINKVLREFSQKENAPLIDIETYFNKLFLQGQKRTDLYNLEQAESHPNAQGYKMMAQYIFKKLKEEGSLGQ